MYTKINLIIMKLLESVLLLFNLAEPKLLSPSAPASTSSTSGQANLCSQKLFLPGSAAGAAALKSGQGR